MDNYKLAVEVAKEVGLGKPVSGNFSKSLTSKDIDQMIRGAFLEKIGTDKMDYYTYNENKWAIFRILSDTITPIVNDRFEDAMGRFAETRQVGFGDTTVFEVENPDLFEVATIAQGTDNLRRQRMDSGRVDVTMSRVGITIYEEFYRFLAGRTNWGRVVEKVAKSIDLYVATMVYNTIYGSYDSLGTNLKHTGSFDESAILNVIQAVEGFYGDAVIVGTKSALAKIKPEYIGGGGKDAYNALGYLGVFRGYETVELAQAYKPGTDEFALSPTDLLVLPQSSEKLVKITYEGHALIDDRQNISDQTIEHSFQMNIGVGIPVAKRFGIIRLTS